MMMDTYPCNRSGPVSSVQSRPLTGYLACSFPSSPVAPTCLLDCHVRQEMAGLGSPFGLKDCVLELKVWTLPQRGLKSLYSHQGWPKLMNEPIEHAYAWQMPRLYIPWLLEQPGRWPLKQGRFLGVCWAKTVVGELGPACPPRIPQCWLEMAYGSPILSGLFLVLWPVHRRS